MIVDMSTGDPHTDRILDIIEAAATLATSTVADLAEALAKTSAVPKSDITADDDIAIVLGSIDFDAGNEIAADLLEKVLIDRAEQGYGR